jgi:hypothetical protein
LAGFRTSFFLERDQLFYVPYAMYPNDESLKIRIPGAGIKQQKFKESTRVNKEEKQFTSSILEYGEPGRPSYPNTVRDDST